MRCGAWSEFFSSMLTKEPQNQCPLFHLTPFMKWLKNIVSSFPCTSICCRLFQHFFGQLSEHFTPCWKGLVWVFWTPSLHVLYLIGWISGLSNHSNLRLERINKMIIYTCATNFKMAWKVMKNNCFLPDSFVCTICCNFFSLSWNKWIFSSIAFTSYSL